jgi:antitoxin MazE
MKTIVRKMGNSQGVLIPKPLLAQAGIEREAEITVENGAIVLRKPKPAVRRDWAEASRNIAAAGDDALAWPEFANEEDAEWQW